MDSNTETLGVGATPEKITPKLVTKIGVAKSSTDNYVFSLVCELPNEQPQLVERVILDKNTVTGLVDILSKELAEEKNNE